MKNIAIVGDFDPDYSGHSSLCEQLDLIASKLHQIIQYDWISYERASTLSEDRLDSYQGYITAPGKPDGPIEGNLKMIRYARENQIPHLGICTGFQHTVIEYAQDVLHLPQAQHEGYDIDASLPFISRIHPPFQKAERKVFLYSNSRLYAVYGHKISTEVFHCTYGVNTWLSDALTNFELKVCGMEEIGMIAALEIPDHPFFISTLFIPQLKRDSIPHPLLNDFVAHCSS